MTLNRKKLKKLVKGNAAPKSILQSQREQQSSPDSPYSIPPQMRQQVEWILSEIFSVSIDVFRDGNGSLSDIPLTSMSSIQLAKSLSSQYKVEISGAQLYTCNNVDDLCRLLLIGDTPNRNVDSISPSNLKESSVPFISVVVSKEDLVITGAACRFPGGIDSLETFWSALLSPETFISCIRKDPPTSRWKGYDVGEERLPPIGWLDDDVFDNSVSVGEFFGLKPSNVEDMSPNARLALQLAHDAIEDAGIASRSLNGRRWGVFSSVNNSGWRERRMQQTTLHGWVFDVIPYYYVAYNSLRLCKGSLWLSR